MIRHVVSWKLAEENPEAREVAALEIKSRLGDLQREIPQILALEVGINVAYPESNWDVVLIADYESLDALQEYQVHPAHTVFVDFVVPQVAKRASVDFEV
ncbi:MAG: Dabb family protein [Microbacteriaceae bacterium]